MPQWNDFWNFLGTNKETITTAIAIAGIVGAVISFLWNQWIAAKARHLEAQRPFLEKQLSLYFETAAINGKLSGLHPTDSEWTNSENRFRQLYWSELSMVESRAVELKMVALEKAMNAYKKDPPNEQKERKFHDCVYDVAHAIRDSLVANWHAKW